MPGIKDQHKDFAMEYFHCRNATKAAISAGYSKKSAASTGARLLKRADVANYLTVMSMNNTEQRQGDIDEARDICWQHLRNGGRDVGVWMGHLIKMNGWGLETSRIELQQLPPPTFVLPQTVEIECLDAGDNGGVRALPVTPTTAHNDPITKTIDVDPAEPSLPQIVTSWD